MSNKTDGYFNNFKNFMNFTNSYRTFLHLIISLFTIYYSLYTAVAQNKGTIFGKIKSQDGKPVELVSIAVLGQTGGVTTDINGRYIFDIPADKELTVVFSCIGYNSEQIQIKLRTGQRKQIDKTLTSKVHNLKEVEVEDIESRKTELQTISPKNATLIPSASGGIEALIKTLPGVSSNNELSSQYSVRGGNFDENLVYVNDVEIYRPFLVRSGEQEGLSFINPDLVSSVSFSAGGFESKYGDKMSSVLDIQYKKPIQFAGSITGSLQGGSAHIEGTALKDRLTYLFGVRQKSNQYILKSLDTKGDYKPSFTDIQTYINYSLSKKWDIGFLGNYSRNKYKVVPQTRQTTFGTIQQALQLTVYFDGQEVDEFDTYQGAMIATFKPQDNLRLKFIASAFSTNESQTYDIFGQYFIGELQNNLGSSSFGQVASDLGVGGFLNHARDYLDANVYSFEHKGSYYTSFFQPLQWGVKCNRETVTDKLNEWNLVDSADYSLPYPPDHPGDTSKVNHNRIKPLLINNLINTDYSLISNRISGFVQNKWNFNTDSTEMSLTVGLRANYWDLNHQTVLGPRATLSVKPRWKRDIVLRFSSGYYYQPPFYKELTDLSGKLYTSLKAQTAVHVIGAMDWNFTAMSRPFKFVTEIYYKYLYNLIPYELNDVNLRYYSNETSTGYAAGIDFKVNGEFVKGLESWASLSLMQTRENVKDDSHGSIPRPEDQWVTFGMFFQDYLPKNPTYKIHLNFLYGSGLPFGPPDSPRYSQNLRMPPYLRVDIGFSKQIKSDANQLSKGNPFRVFKNIWLSLEVFNLLQANNVISYIWIKDVLNQGLAVPNYLTPRQLNLKLFCDF
jgi:hypothetical protein